MWKELLLNITKDNEYVKLNPPATAEEILAVEKRLNITLPKQLKNLLLEFNGDNNFILSTKEIIETNTSLRELECFMTLNSLLFIAGNGFGDYFGYPITGEGIRDNIIFMWDHEDDSRAFSANGLKEVIEKHYNDEI